MFSSRKSDTNSSPFSPFKDDSMPTDWASPAASDMGAAPSDIGSEFLPVEPETAFGGATPAAPSSATRNVLNQDVTVVGTLRFTDDLLVDGSVMGEITSDGELTVGENATIQAGEKDKVAVRTRSAIIYGRVTGDVVVTDRVELGPKAELVGDITAAKIAIQEGATFVGHCTVGNISALPATPAASSKNSAKRTTLDLDDTPNLLG